ncbi:ABC transporter permease [Streptomyces sp. NPDC052042]|uniref:ABC transporter permease n=1 Tax=Streptomyces sp. NPDC052042 TaxID=3365683 RepID=UPI0037D3B866
MTTETVGVEPATKKAGTTGVQARGGWRSLTFRASTAVSAAWLGLLALAGLAFPLLPLPDPARSDYGAIGAAPGYAGHLLGTDTIGRDMLSRLIIGGRVSLTVGIGGVALAVLIGSLLGLLAGFHGGVLSRVINALMDILLAFPSLVALIALSVFIGTGLKMIIIGIGLITAPQVARVTRAATLSFTQREFVTAARGMGAGGTRILIREIVPNVVGPVIAFATVLVAVAIVAEGSLSFLGLGVPPPASSWGTMMADGRSEFENNPHIALLPAAAMFVTLLALYFLAEALNRRFDVKEAAL